MNDSSADTGSASADPFYELFQKILQQSQRQKASAKHQQHDVLPILSSTPSYMILLQHSTRVDLRLQQHSQPSSKSSRGGGGDDSSSLYRRAGVLTPWEIGARDIQAGALFLEHTVEQLSQSCSLSSQHNQQQPAIIYLRTIPKPPPSWLSQLSNVTIVDLGLEKNDLWDSDETLAESQESLSDIWNSIYSTRIKSYNIAAIVLESVTPLQQRFGFRQVSTFLFEVQNGFTNPATTTTTSNTFEPPPILLVPARMETLSTQQHRILEDMAQALLCLEQGQATWLHQGVRERANVMRESLQYNIQHNAGNNVRPKLVLQLEEKDGDGDKNEKTKTNNQDDAVTQAKDQVASMSIAEPPSATASPPLVETATATTAVPSSSSRANKKIQLTVSEEGRHESAPAATPTPAPRIYMQDDDPEFSDYDEEDPDDDLDI